MRGRVDDFEALFWDGEVGIQRVRGKILNYAEGLACCVPVFGLLPERSWGRHGGGVWIFVVLVSGLCKTLGTQQIVSMLKLTCFVVYCETRLSSNMAWC